MATSDDIASQRQADRRTKQIFIFFECVGNTDAFECPRTRARPSHLNDIANIAYISGNTNSLDLNATRLCIPIVVSLHNITSRC